MAITRPKRPPPVPEKKRIAVTRDGTHTYAHADTVAVNTSMTGGVEISFLSLRMKVEAQEFEVVAEDHSAQTLTSPVPRSTASIVEVATIRASKALAIDIAATILKHLVSNGEDKGVIHGALRDAGVID